MERPMIHEIQELRRDLIQMAGYTEDMLECCGEALRTGGDEVLAGMDELEDKVNRAELDTDERAIKIIALYAPEASDLRFIAMALKINNDLERVGDHALNIRDRILELGKLTDSDFAEDIQEMTQLVRKQLRRSINAFIEKSSDLAREVLDNDDQVDQYRDKLFSSLIGCTNQDNANRSVSLMLLVKDLERIGDLATNIGEDVIYLTQGTLIKHGGRPEDE